MNLDSSHFIYGEGGFAFAGLVLLGMPFMTSNPKILTAAKIAGSVVSLTLSSLKVGKMTHHHFDQNDPSATRPGPGDAAEPGPGDAAKDPNTDGAEPGLGDAANDSNGLTAKEIGGVDVSTPGDLGGGIIVIEDAPAEVVAVVAVVSVLAFPVKNPYDRVRSDVVFEIGRGIQLINGTSYFTHGYFDSAFPVGDTFPNNSAPENMSAFFDAERKAVLSFHQELKDAGVDFDHFCFHQFPNRIGENGHDKVCLQIYSARGTQRGCSGMICYEIEGTKKFLVCAFNNPYSRDQNNLSYLVCIADFPILCNQEHAAAVLEVAKAEQSACGCGFASISFNEKQTVGEKREPITAGTIATQDQDFRVEGRMTACCRSTVYVSLSKLTPSTSITAGTIATQDQDFLVAGRMTAYRRSTVHSSLSKLTPSTARMNDARMANNLAAATLFAKEASINRGGTLTYRNGGGGCARDMIVRFRTADGMEKEVNKTNVVALPKGAKEVRVKFNVIGGSVAWRVDRRRPKQPWIRNELGTCEEEVLEFEDGDGVDAVFVVRGTSLHSYVHKAWDFGREPDVPKRGWEWWGYEPGAVERCNLLPNLKEMKARLSICQTK